LYRVYTRELDGVLVTEYLSYIHLTNGPYYTNLAYFKKIDDIFKPKNENKWKIK